MIRVRLKLFQYMPYLPRLLSYYLFVMSFLRFSHESRLDVISSTNSIKHDVITRSLSKPEWITFDEIMNGRKFNISGHDMLVILHIQKTAGTSFEKNLVYNLKLENPCSCQEDKRQCSCPRSSNRTVPDSQVTFVNRSWLMSRFSFGWICGLHADWTQLDYCLQGLGGLYLTSFVRNPLYRFVSEFRHVQRGATWKSSVIHCSEYNNRLCFANKSHWFNVTLEDFMNCSSNMAVNRQTRMLANIKSVGCKTNTKDFDRKLLESAKQNLRNLSYFGICEQQSLSQAIFEKTFQLSFRNNFTQSDDNTTKSIADELSDDVRERIVALNNLDMELYQYALDLFKERCITLVLDGCG